MKHLVYIVTCFFTLLFFATATGKPRTTINFHQHQLESQFFNKNLSVSQSHISVDFMNIKFDFCPEDMDEIDFDKHSFDHYALLKFDEVFSFFLNYQSSKTEANAKSTHQIVHATAIPFYILFHSMIIPSAN